nr:reverse transcriptase domain-containing protein [Tanacetum cinerariifolium]
MDNVRQDRRKDVYTRLDFGECPRERAREDSHHSSARDRTTKPERVRVQDRLRYDNHRVLDRLGHRRQSAFDRLSETYSPSTTKSHPHEADSRGTLRGSPVPSYVFTLLGIRVFCELSKLKIRGVNGSSSSHIHGLIKSSSSVDLCLFDFDLRYLPSLESLLDTLDNGDLLSLLLFIWREQFPLRQDWQMCVDFTDLNKACSQDSYPLSEIDWKVESLCGYPFKYFLDAYKGYHQIQLAEPDKEKTAFHTRQEVYCYTKMPFGLKNAGATYQRLMDKVFEGQIGRNIEVYVDDLVVKSYKEAEMMRDIEETFRTLRKVNMKLNPKSARLGTSRSAQRQIHKGAGGGNSDRGRRTDLGNTISGLLKRRNPPRRQERGKKALPQGPTIQVNGWGPLHTVVPYVVVKMRQTAPGGWGIDIAGPFPEGPGKVKFLIVAMDYFTKLIEAKAVATITGGLRFTSVKHPQSYGLVERANRSLGEGIKSRLEEGNKNWVEEPPHVLWANRTMIKSSHSDTPFFLTYGTEAVIPTEIGMPTYRTTAVDVVSNDEELRLNLDLLEERRERAAIYEAKANSKMTKYYNARVRNVTFKPGDFVYRGNDASHAVAGGKLGPKWEGPYEVTEALGNRAYKLRSMDETIIPKT